MTAIPLKKRLGQHHLVDAGPCRRLLDFLSPEGELVLEIGPGGGVLTRALLERGARIWAWEIDPDWAFELRGRLGRRRLDVVVADALDLPWERLDRGCLVTGNLPFNVGTALIERLLLGVSGVPRAAFLVQKEVAARLTAGAGDPDYGSLSVLVAARARTHRLGGVPASRFRPSPKVDGAFVGFELVEPAVPQGELGAFAGTVRAAFGLRRKTLRNSLAAAWGRARADEAIQTLGFDLKIRAEALELADFVRLHGWTSSTS